MKMNPALTRCASDDEPLTPNPPHPKRTRLGLSGNPENASATSLPSSIPSSSSSSSSTTTTTTTPPSRTDLNTAATTALPLPGGGEITIDMNLHAQYVSLLAENEMLQHGVAETKLELERLQIQCVQLTLQLLHRLQWKIEEFNENFINLAYQHGFMESSTGIVIHAIGDPMPKFWNPRIAELLSATDDDLKNPEKCEQLVELLVSRPVFEKVSQGLQRTSLDHVVFTGSIPKTAKNMHLFPGSLEDRITVLNAVSILRNELNLPVATITHVNVIPHLDRDDGFNPDLSPPGGACSDAGGCDGRLH